MLNQLNGKVEKWKMDYIGIDDDGRMVFFYPDAIKHHKNKDGNHLGGKDIRTRMDV